MGERLGPVDAGWLKMFTSELHWKPSMNACQVRGWGYMWRSIARCYVGDEGWQDRGRVNQIMKDDHPRQMLSAQRGSR